MARVQKLPSAAAAPPESAAFAAPARKRAGAGETVSNTAAPNDLAPTPSQALPPEALADVVTAEDVFLSPKAVAAITGLDEKWLAAAREGLKGVDGPPFKKLGDAKSAPIRYNLAELRNWWSAFPSRLTTHGKQVHRFASAADFFKGSNLDEKWLFALVDDEPIDIVVALNANAFEEEEEPDLNWLSFPEWLSMAWRTPRYEEQVKKSMRTLREFALSTYEEDFFRSSVKAGAKTRRPRIDDRKPTVPHDAEQKRGNS